MKNNLPKNKVTLEDLLRVKRAERPSTEFWGQFESELRAKQLTAIIEKRSWWQTLPSLAWVRWGLASMGTAAAAITVAILNLPAGVSTDVSGSSVAMQSVPAQVNLASPIVLEDTLSSATFAAAIVRQIDRVVDRAAIVESEVVTVVESPSSARNAVILASAPKLVSLSLDESLIPPPSQAPTLAPEFAMLGQTGRTQEDPLAAMPTPREKRNQTLMALQESEVRPASMSVTVSDRASSNSSTLRQMNLRPERSDVQFAVAGIGVKIPAF